MGQYKYVTNRTLTDASGQPKGRIKVLVPADSDTAQVEYACPECGHSEKKSQPWARPFSIKCGKCGMIIKIPKLKDEIKKDKKRKSA
jgi:peptide subunit release factor 1 (eRF1)